MKWSRKHTGIAGLALIAGVNAIALGGAAYNRSGEAESSLRLSERELHLPYVWRGNKENSGVELKLDWRVLPPEPRNAKDASWRYSGYGTMPDWLDEAKMTALGFDASKVGGRGYSERSAERLLTRDVLLVRRCARSCPGKCRRTSYR